MKKKLALLLSIILILSLSLTTIFAQQPQQPRQSLVHKPGKIAYEHLKVLSEDIGRRIAGSEKEVEARNYIEEEFKKLGFETTIQEFSYVRRGETYHSANVIAVKHGKSTEEVIVGAHYDSVSVGRGADDNASGVGVILEAAEVLKNINTPYTIRYIAFGAEEVGLQGSSYYVSQMTEEEIKNTVAMINLDSLIAGDKMYVHGGLITQLDASYSEIVARYGSEENGWVRDQAMAIAKRKNINLEINPGLNEFYPAGTTGDWSDHAPFVKIGIPYAYFEATNWEIDWLDGYTQTEEHGSFWHTHNDTIEKIEEAFPGRIEERLSSFSTVLIDLLKFMNKSSIAK